MRHQLPSQLTQPEPEGVGWWRGLFGFVMGSATHQTSDPGGLVGRVAGGKGCPVEAEAVGSVVFWAPSEVSAVHKAVWWAVEVLL